MGRKTLECYSIQNSILGVLKIPKLPILCILSAKPFSAKICPHQYIFFCGRIISKLLKFGRLMLLLGSQNRVNFRITKISIFKDNFPTRNLTNAAKRIQSQTNEFHTSNYEYRISSITSRSLNSKLQKFVAASNRGRLLSHFGNLKSIRHLSRFHLTDLRW